MLKRIFFITLSVSLIVLLGVWWNHTQTKSSIDAKIKILPITVKVVPVSQLKIPDMMNSVGNLQAKQQINVAAQIAGQVTAVDFVPGSLVQKGQVLVELDDRIYRSQLQSAQSALNLAAANYRRYTALAKSGALSKQEIDQIAANYQQAQAALSMNQTYLSQTKITAPFSGYVGPRMVNVGNYVEKGQALTTLTDRSVLEVNYAVSEKFLPHIRLGQAVSISVEENKEGAYQGKVTYVSPTISEDTHSVNLQAEIPNVDNKLSPGLFVKVKQSFGDPKNALVLPKEAIVAAITGDTVYVVRNGHAQLVPVKTGLTFKGKVEVIEGLQLGEQVVVAGQDELRDGAAVTILHSTKE